MKVIVPFERVFLVSFKWLLEVGGHVPGDGDAEDQRDTHPEGTVEVRLGPDVVLEEGLPGERNHGVHHPVLHHTGVHVKELLIEFKFQEVWRPPTAAGLLVCYQLTERLEKVRRSVPRSRTNLVSRSVVGVGNWVKSPPLEFCWPELPACNNRLSVNDLTALFWDSLYSCWLWTGDHPPPGLVWHDRSQPLLSINPNKIR